jgi:hypothetical protein
MGPILGEDRTGDRGETQTVIALLMVLGVLGAGLAAFWYYGAKPARHRNLTRERLTTLVGTLLERGQNGSALFVEERRGSRFVQLTKYVGDRNHWGIQCDFPIAPWSEPYYAQVPECVSKLGLSFCCQAFPGGAVHTRVRFEPDDA